MKQTDSEMRTIEGNRKIHLFDFRDGYDWKGEAEPVACPVCRMPVSWQLHYGVYLTTCSYQFYCSIPCAKQHKE